MLEQLDAQDARLAYRSQVRFLSLGTMILPEGLKPSRGTLANVVKLNLGRTAFAHAPHARGAHADARIGAPSPCHRGRSEPDGVGLPAPARADTSSTAEYRLVA